MTLPIRPFDGQEFIDSFRVLWRFDAEFQCWKRLGTVSDIPLASEDQTGLLSTQLKGFIDTVPEKGGGFGIVVDPKLTLRTEDNPDGVIFGDVELVSNTLNINCVFADGSTISSDCIRVPFSPEIDDFPPGFDINFDEVFLKTMCAEIPGGPGPKGDDGDEGDSGAPGTGDGPQGEQGATGLDAIEAATFTSIKIEDISDIFDTAVVNLELDASGGRLHVTKSKIRVPSDDTPADQVVTSAISRSLEFGDGFGFTLLSPNNDPIDNDPTIGFYPQSFNESGGQGGLDRSTETQFVSRKLSEFLTDVTMFYQGRLDEIADNYDTQLEEHFIRLDEDARQKLDVLAMQMADCEFQLPIDYCVGISPSDCGADGESAEALCALAGFLTGDPDFCEESAGDDMGTQVLSSSESVAVTFSFTGQPSSATLPSGAYLVIYTDGTFFDSDDPDKGYFVETTLSSAGGGGGAGSLSFPAPSGDFDKFDPSSVRNAYLSGPLADRSFVVTFDSDGGSLTLDTPSDGDIAGTITFHIVKCSKCPAP